MYKPRSIIKPSEERLRLGLQIYNFFLNAQKFVDNLSENKGLQMSPRTDKEHSRSFLP